MVGKYIMSMIKNILVTTLLTSVVIGLTSCASAGGSSVLPNNGPTMSQIYNQQYSEGYASGDSLHKVRSTLRTLTRRQLGADPMNLNQEEPRTVFNPTMRIYVYPHSSSNGEDYIPGHYAYTKFHKEARFALPGQI